MLDLDRGSNRIFVKLNSNNSLYGELPDNWGMVAPYLKKRTDVLDYIENKADVLLTALTATNADVVGLVDEKGLSLVDAANISTGLMPYYDLTLKKWYMQSPVLSATVAAMTGILGSALVDGLNYFANSFQFIPETYDEGYRDGKIETDLIYFKSGNITGVSITKVVGNEGQYTLVYNATAKSLAFGGGTAQVAYILAATPVDYKMELVASDGVTKIDVLVDTALLPGSNQTDRVGVISLKGTSVDQPTNITGVTLSQPTGTIVKNTLAYDSGAGTLVWGGGTPVVLTDGRNTLTDTAGNTIIALVDLDSLPVGNQTDANLQVHRCLVPYTDNLLVNLKYTP